MISAAPFRSEATSSSTRIEIVAELTILSSAFRAPMRKHAAAFDAEFAGEHETHGLGVDAVLFEQDALG